ncbi:hypothetical protein ACQP2K_08145 [Microbispora siamensis]
MAQGRQRHGRLRQRALLSGTMLAGANHALLDDTLLDVKGGRR